MSRGAVPGRFASRKGCRRAAGPTLGRVTEAVRILVVDDDPTVSEVVARYLARDGYAVEAVADGREALDRALAAPPDLVVLDLMLPGIDGLEVCRRLRAMAPVPIVILTARGQESDRIVGLDLGRRRLRGQAVLDQGAGRPGAGGAPPGAGAAGAAAPGDGPQCYVDGDLEVDVAARQARLGGDGRVAHRPRVRAAGLPRPPPRRGVPTRGAARGGVGLPLRRHVHGDRPRPAPAGEDRARPVAARAHRHRLGRRVPVGGRVPAAARCPSVGAATAAAVLVVAGGLLVALAAAAALGLPADDTAVLVAISFGVALATYVAGRAALARGRAARWWSRLIPVVAVALGALVAAKAMFVSSHDLAALVVVVGRRGDRRACSAGWRWPRSWRGRAAGSTTMADASAPSSTAAASWWPGSATTCARRSPASGRWPRRSTTASWPTRAEVHRYHLPARDRGRPARPPRGRPVRAVPHPGRRAGA